MITNPQTETIQVPVASAREVKLFINLLQTGEIDSLSDLLASAGLDKPALFDLTNLDDVWKAVASKICPPTTQALLRQQCHLISLTDNKAVLGISSPKLAKFLQGKIPNIEAAFKASGYEVEVELITNDSQPQVFQTVQLRANLTEDQQRALSQLKFFTQSQDKFFRLTGYAGTGKSFLMCHYIKWLLSEEITFVAACPTKQRVAQIVV